MQNFKCSECQSLVRPCTSTEEIKLEIPQSSYICTACGFTYGETATEELEEVNIQYKIKCCSCDKLFRDDDDLEKLELEHDQIYACPKCKTDEFLIDL